ncbi:MAG TPA: terminase large subunit [Solirubrobacterales bacterium]|nr:terminase large subunit [Solirubrobacterales bacterium]HNB58672.1 terminase large subunit [Phycisphaerales bacterium]
MPKTAPRAKGWWGVGKSPAQRYPGVSIEIPAVWSKKRDRWESPDGRYYYDQGEADRYVEFFPGCLRLHIGEFAGQPFDLLDYAEWLIVRPLFGWKHTDTGYRRFRKVFLAIPKGNAKSPLAAGIGLALLTIDDEPGAEVYAFAADKQQAGIVFGDSKIMVENSPDLLEELVVYKDSIVNRSTRSKYQVRSKTVATSHGPRPHALLGDEFHAQQNRDLFESMHRGTYKRRQPVTFLCTTAGDDDESICFEEWEYAAKVISGTHEDETLLPVIFEARPDEDWQSEQVWARVNPGLGVTVKLEGIRQAAKEAAAEPRKRNDFLRYHLNRWVNQAVAWLPIEWWDACTAGLPPDEVLATLDVGCGLDLSQRYDLTAFVATFRQPLEEAREVTAQLAQEPTEDGQPQGPKVVSLNYRLIVVPFFWLPKDTLDERVKQDRVQYDRWAAQGFLTVTDGGMIDYDRVRNDIVKKIGPRLGLLRGEVGYDPAFASDIAPKLAGEGYQMVEILQGYKYLSEPAQVFEALLRNRRIVHGKANPVMRWNVENVAVKTDESGRIRPVKPKRAAKRIDGVVATLMGLNRLIANPDQRSVYEDRGITFL